MPVHPSKIPPLVHAPPLALDELALALDSLVSGANAYAGKARSDRTRRAYATDFAAFVSFCAHHSLSSLPSSPATVAVYLAALAQKGRRPSTIERALAGIAFEHRRRGHAWFRGHPAIGAVMGGIRREMGMQPNQKRPVDDAELSQIVAAQGHDLAGLRDRSLLTLGWFGAFRRSELAALTVSDIAYRTEGIVVTVRRSKSDQEGHGAKKGIPYAARVDMCPVRALLAWTHAASVTDGPLFRAVDCHGHVSARALDSGSVARIVKRAARHAGIDPTSLGGHSLRAGFCTTAARRGKSLDAIMRQTLHKSERVARAYIRHASLFEDNAAGGLL